jgi:hypothetical protein
VKGRAMVCFRLTAWLGRKHDEVSYHRWPAAGGALSTRKSVCSTERSSGGGDRYVAAARSDLETMAMWWRRSAAVWRRKEDDAVEEMAGTVLLQKWRKGSGGGGLVRWCDVWRRNGGVRVPAVTR